MGGKKVFNLIIGLVVILAAVFAYFYFVAGGGEEVTGLTSTSGVGATADSDPASREFLVILNTLNAIRLNAAILEDPHFQNLKDFSVTLVPEPRGRQNPFAPIGVGNFVSTSTLNSTLNSSAGSRSGLSPAEQSRILDDL